MDAYEPDHELLSEPYELNPWYTNGGVGAEGYNQARVRAPATLTPSYNVGAHHEGKVNTLAMDGSVKAVGY